MTHATPASIYAHSADRDWECYKHLVDNKVEVKKGIREIAWQLFYREPGNATKVMMGGGEKNFRPKGMYQTNGKGYNFYKCYTKEKYGTLSKFFGKYSLFEFFPCLSSLNFENNLCDFCRAR